MYWVLTCARYFMYIVASFNPTVTVSCKHDYAHFPTGKRTERLLMREART